MTPLTAILTGLVVIVFIVIIFWPDKGFIALWKRSIWDAKRILLEDTLKLLYTLEEREIFPTSKEIEKELSVSSNKGNDLIRKLNNLNFIQVHGNILRLTEEGKNYSLQIIRNHRLWEKFLADETAVKEIDWHKEAEHAEHMMTPEQADELAAKIGNPLIDPHGDPIPTSDWKMPDRKGYPISELEENEYAEIIHIEDEPVEIHKRLVEAGIYAGMYIRLKTITEENITFMANGKEFKIEPECADNISVTNISPEFMLPGTYKSLSTLKVGEKGKIFGISNAIRGKQRRRLLDFGIVPGTEIVPFLVSFSGEPVAYNIRGTSIALRKEQTDLIFVEDKKDE